jgi:hypothetical protein
MARNLAQGYATATTATTRVPRSPPLHLRPRTGIAAEKTLAERAGEGSPDEKRRTLRQLPAPRTSTALVSHGVGGGGPAERDLLPLPPLPDAVTLWVHGGRERWETMESRRSTDRDEDDDRNETAGAMTLVASDLARFEWDGGSADFTPAEAEPTPCA